MRTSALGLPFLGLAWLVLPSPAQETPPEPLPVEAFELPPFQEGVLGNGARIVVVEQRELPFVTVSLVLPGGRAVDPPDRSGLAALTAGLITRGTTRWSADEIEERSDFLGARLEASAEADWTAVRLEAVTPVLPEMLALMADVVLDPTFPEEELELLRRRTISGLQVFLAEPATLAERAFLREVYGDHPYGQLPTTESLESLDRDAVTAFHGTWYRPGRAIFVVAGDLDLERATSLLEEAFGAWEPTLPPEVAWTAPPVREAPRVVLVHQPGAVQAVVRVGHLLFRGDHPEWTPLTTLNQVIGGGPNGRLFRILREERGLTYAAYSQMERRLDRGFFRASAESRTEVAGDLVEEMLAQVVRVREETIGPGELEDAQDFLVGTFPLQLETPQQFADALTMGRVYGLPDSALVTYRERVTALGPQDLREIAVKHLHPERLVWVVVGDAVALLPRLRTLGDVKVVDAEGSAVDMADLLPRGRSILLDASGLEPVDAEYRVVVQGRSVGTLARTLEAGPTPGIMFYRGTADLGIQTVTQSVAFSVPGFESLGAVSRIESEGQITSAEIEVKNGRITGRIVTPEGSQDVDEPLPSGAVLGDMIELVLWLADLEEGMDFTVPLVRVETGAVYNVPYRVVDLEDVEVPAGTFEAFRVEMGGPQPQTLWVRREAPHVLLRSDPTGDPVTFELTTLDGG